MDRWLCLVCGKELESEEEVELHLSETRGEPEHKRVREEIEQAVI